MRKFVFQNEEGTFVIRYKDTIIELTKEEINVFIWFRKYQGIFEKIRKLKGGSVTLHCDEKEGNIRQIEWNFKEPLDKVS